MNTKETALIALMATVFSLVVCQVLARVGAQQVHLSGAQAMSGLAICLAGVAVGLLLVLGASTFQGSESGLERSLGAFGLVLGCALLLALLVSQRPAHAHATHHAAQPANGVMDRVVLLAPGSWR